MQPQVDLEAYSSKDNYNGASSGDVCGPSNAMTQVAPAGCLMSLFLVIFPTDKRVNLQRSSQYCRQCYRNLCNGDDDDTALLYDQKKKCATVCVVDARLVMNPFAKNAGKLGTICTIEIVHNTPSF